MISSTLSTISTTITIPIYSLRDCLFILELKPYILYNILNVANLYLKVIIAAGRHTMEMIKVSANSRTSAVAGAIAGVIREHKRAEVQAIGAGAVNQAVKALVLAIGYLDADGIKVACVPEFADVTIDDKVRTAIKLVIEVR
jgi:stage V sporulation protein S